MPSFSQDITRFVEKTKLRLVDVLRQIALQGFVGVIEKSPVDTARFRGSWRVGVNRTDLSVESVRTSTSGLAVGEAASSTELAIFAKAISGLSSGDVISITNNLHYAGALESGFSAQTGHAAGGILDRTFQELTVDFLRTLEAVKQASR